MATTKISVGSVGVSGHLIGLIRKTSDLTTVVQKIDLYPANNGSFIFTGIDPDTYQLEVRDSPDGTALGTLLSPPYFIDVESNNVDLEFVFYTVDGIGAHDPASGTATITDPYLDGKNVQGVFKEAARFLKITAEYTLVAGGGIHLEGGALFSPGEVITVIITALVPAVVTTSSIFAGRMTITTDTTFDSTFYNKKIKCQSGGIRMVNILPDISTVPDGKFFYFTTFNGGQYNTVFNTTGGQTIEGYGTKIILGQNETMWIEKYGSMWQIISVSDGVKYVGRRLAGRLATHENTLPENDALYDALDYPRLFNWVSNILPATHRIITTDTLIASYVRTDANRSLFIVSPGKVRMPDSQNLSERGLLNFTTYNADTQRIYDYPGGGQLEQVGPHWHEVETQNLGTNPPFERANNHNVRSWNAAPQIDINKNSSTDENKQADNSTYVIENRVKNFGVIYLTMV